MNIQINLSSKGFVENELKCLIYCNVTFPVEDQPQWAYEIMTHFYSLHHSIHIN